MRRTLLWFGLLAIGPLAIVFAYFAHERHWLILTKPPNEAYAVIVLGVAFVVYAFRARREHSLLMALLAGYALAAWMREWHFDWTHHGIYVFLLLLIGGAAMKWKRIRGEAPPNFQPWFGSTLLLYFIGVLIARRVFRDYLPDEEGINTQLEEFMENVAHTMLFLTSLVGTRKALTQRQTERDTGSAER